MLASASDPALDTLFLPLVEGALRWPRQGGALFLNARPGAALQRSMASDLHCVQGFKPAFDALQGLGLRVQPEVQDGQRFALVMLLPGRQREAARALYAEALQRLVPGGALLAAQANAEGARTMEADLRRLLGPLQVQSKHRCRVVWTRLEAPPSSDLASQWRDAGGVQQVPGSDYLSRPGLFAWDRIDAASQLLVEHLPSALAGRAADLGAGWGYLSAELLRRCSAIQSLDLFEADARALPLAQSNLQRWAAGRPVNVHWQDVTAGLPGRYDLIVSNPPFHGQQAADRPDIGRAFIERAAAALNPGGRLWLVANRHLPYEAILQAEFQTVRCVVQQAGFKVIEAAGARAGQSR